MKPRRAHLARIPVAEQAPVQLVLGLPDSHPFLLSWAAPEPTPVARG